ncbi:hypothetical protein MMC10_009915 [Thelotrema lepadinum]|nr:hypothetical protein [Thelotrema lepadinum]
MIIDMMLFKVLVSGLLLRLSSAAASARQDTVTTIIDDIESATTCAACDSLLVVLQGVAHLGNDAFVDTISEVCIETGAEDPDVCQGAIAREGPILAHDLREMTIPSHTSQLFCTTIFGLCDYPAVTAETISFPSPKPVVNRPIPSTQDPIQIVHISDIHVDLSYEVGSSYNCTKNICCRPYTSAEAPGNNSYPAGPYGEHTCDSPASLEESLYNAIETIAPNAAFTMFTGDVVEGAVWLTTQIEVTNDLQNAYGKMSGLNLVYAAVENHDSNPVNSFPPAAVSTTLTNQWVYDTLSSLWETWIGTSAAAMADENPGAYSTVYPGNTTGKLRVISFDTNMYYKENFWLYETTMEQDPSGQLAWLVQELQAAEDAGERVYILGHMPMGSGDALHDGSNYFDQIINRYEATIAALFFGHTHKDEFELSYSNYASQSPATASAISYIAPALTPTSGNPAFRIYTVDPTTFAVLDITTYAANLSLPSYQTSSPI